MKRFAHTLQAGNTVHLHYLHMVNGEAVDFDNGDNFIIAIYNINRRCLFSASINDGTIEKGSVSGEYICTMNFSNTVYMPDKTIMEMVVKDADGTVKHIEDDVMIFWNNNTINDLIR